MPWPAAPCSNSESLSRPLSSSHFFAAARHNTHHDLLPPSFSPLSAPLPADLRTSITAFAGARFVDSLPFPRVTRLPARSEPLESLLFLACFSPGLPCASPSPSPLSRLPLLHPVLRSPLWQGVRHTIRIHPLFVKLYLKFFSAFFSPYFPHHHKILSINT